MEWVNVHNMFKYIIIIIIIFLLAVLFGYRQLFGAWQTIYIKLGDYYESTFVNDSFKQTSSQKPSSSFQNSEWEKYKQHKGEYFFPTTNKNPVETNSWKFYKKTFISDDGRVIDHQRGSVTTSEGQAYAMRRALIMGDKVTFDKTYDWAKYNLQHKFDKLFAWLWGPENLGKPGEAKYGIIDQNSATDADTEIAITLFLASKVWKQENYKQDALGLINDIWKKETVVIKGERILTAGVNQSKGEIVEVNPSYFMPSGYRIFAEIDPKHDWQKLVDSSYRLTNWCVNHIPSGLPPDFFYMNRNTGAITFDKDKCDFSYDAVRVFYRFYVDYIVTRDQRARNILSKSKIFIDRWKREGTFYTCYKQNSELKNFDESIGAIALILPVIKMYDKNIADEIYRNRIKAKYHSAGYWDNPINYYAQNLVWLGFWLYQNEENIRSFKY